MTSGFFLSISMKLAVSYIERMPSCKLTLVRFVNSGGLVNKCAKMPKNGIVRGEYCK